MFNCLKDYIFIKNYQSLKTVDLLRGYIYPYTFTLNLNPDFFKLITTYPYTYNYGTNGTIMGREDHEA